MVYHDHMMTSKTQIRLHLFTHFGEVIYKMVIATPDGGFKCPQCDFTDDVKTRKFRDHLGIYHKVLDKLVEEHSPAVPVAPEQPAVKKKLSLKDYKKKFHKTDENKEKEEQPMETEKTPAPPTTQNHDLFSCSICNKWDSKEKIRQHCVQQHFTEELKTLAVEKYATDKPCKNCPPGLDLNHLALDHGWIDGLMADPRLIDMKRSELMEKPKNKRRSSIDLTQNVKRNKVDHPFKCVLCGRNLAFKDHNGAVEHFSTHVWIQMQDIKQENKSQLFNALMAKLPIKPWLDHHDLTPAKSPEGKIFVKILAKRVQDIIDGKWCCICLDLFENNHHCKKDVDPGFLTKKLSSVEEIESLRDVVSPRKIRKGSGDKQPKVVVDDDKEPCEHCPEGFKSSDYLYFDIFEQVLQVIIELDLGFLFFLTIPNRISLFCILDLLDLELLWKLFFGKNLSLVVGSTCQFTINAFQLCAMLCAYMLEQ